MPPYSIYFHIPFCTHRCGYCDFNTYAGLETLIPRYVEALCAEMRFCAQSAGEQLAAHTVFFGGGTPSLLPIHGLEQILETLHELFEVQPGCEITLEANPGTLSLDYLRRARQMGVNRLSLGMQSAHPHELRLLQRRHTYPDVIQAVTWTRQAGFDNLNLDLIFGLPEEELATWQRSLELALGLHPEHFSLYALTIEHGTPFGRWAERGLLSMPDPDLAADMYEWSAEKLDQNGYAQYEISNWAKHLPSPPGAGESTRACRHNLQYWRTLPYLGFGAGAHGYAAGVRTANILSPQGYIQQLAVSDRLSAISFPGTPATQTSQVIDQQAEIGETMMMGLRLTQEGVSAAGFYRRFGQTLNEVFHKPIERLTGQGLLEWAGEDHDTLRLTQRGRLLGNRVFREFI